jgi:hypothetical protein
MKKELIHLGKWLNVQRDEDKMFVHLFWKELVFNLGTIVKEKNGDITVQKRVWGLQGHSWLQIVRLDRHCFAELGWWKKQQKFFCEQEKAIQKGKRLHPTMMTPMQRHDQTAKVVRKMRWSKTFVEAMTTPLTLQALESGGIVNSLLPVNDDGIDSQFVLDPEEFKRLSRLTQKDLRNKFRKMRAKWLQSKNQFKLDKPEA